MLLPVPPVSGALVTACPPPLGANEFVYLLAYDLTLGPLVWALLGLWRAAWAREIVALLFDSRPQSSIQHPPIQVFHTLFVIVASCGVVGYWILLVLVGPTNIIIVLSFYVVEGCELAYAAPSAIIKQRKRGYILYIEGLLLSSSGI